jgi:hypothetical protein
MRKYGLGLALLASAQLTLLSSPAFADGSGKHDMPGPAQDEPAATGSKTTGWVVLGIGGGLTVAGVVLDIVGATQSKNVPGEGGPGAGQTTSNARTNFFWGGTALIVAGLVTSVVGVSFILHPNDDTNKKPADKPIDDASTDALRGAAEARLQSAPTVMVPILGATF